MNRPDTGATMRQAAELLQDLGASYEHPGYISVKGFAFGDANGDFGYNYEADDRAGAETDETIPATSTPEELAAFIRQIVTDDQLPCLQEIKPAWSCPGAPSYASFGYSAESVKQLVSTLLEGEKKQDIPDGLELCQGCGGQGFVENPEAGPAYMSCYRCGETGYCPAGSQGIEDEPERPSGDENDDGFYGDTPVAPPSAPPPSAPPPSAPPKPERDDSEDIPF